MHAVSLPSTTMTHSAYQRTTLALKGTTFRTSAQLDHRSTVALQWSYRWLSAAGGLKVPASGVLRRALALYVHHLEQPGTDQEEEVRAVRIACASTLPDKNDQQAAMQRLDATPVGTMPPPYLEVLHGPGAAARAAALTETAEALAAQCMPRKLRSRAPTA
jgi:hypothetical protein